MLEAPESGFRPLGFINVESPVVTFSDRPTQEAVEQLRGVFREYSPDCVFVASPGISSFQLTAIMQAARQEGLVVRIFTHLHGVMPSRLTVHSFGPGGVALALKPARLTTAQRAVKRAMDLCIAGLGLLVALPLLVVIALLIKLTSRGPVLFRQERVTEDGRTFQMLKFRTMRQDADRVAADHAMDTSVPFFKMKDDPRLTRLGRWLRKLSLDEVPQLLNVVRGDMSLVGPRPLPADQVAANQELLGPRHEVRAGITGWWQIQGRSDVTPEEAIGMDGFYIQNWSPLLDMYILLRTLRVLVGHTGAY